MIVSVHTLVFSLCCAQFNVIATVVMDTSHGQHDVVLYFRFLHIWTAVGEDVQFHFALYDYFLFLLVPQLVLSTVHSKREPIVIDSSDFFSSL